jgi:hypothetical protein
MEIAIVAHDKKKELMAEFCTAYCGILCKHNLCATSITAKYISEATGLNIERLLTGDHGGEEQIAQRIAYNEIDLLIDFRDNDPVKTAFGGSGKKNSGLNRSQTDSNKSTHFSVSLYFRLIIWQKHLLRHRTHPDV